MPGNSGTLRQLLGPRLGARSLVTPAAHILVLCAFAVAQPLYYLFGQNAEFFAARGSPPSDIVVFALAILLVPPAALMLVEWVAALVGERVWQVVHIVFIAGLATLVLLQGEKHLAEGKGGSLIVVAVLAGAAAAFAYVKVGAVRSFLTVLVPAPFIFAGLFLFNSPINELLHVDHTPVQAAAAVDAQIPVVFVMFDELGTGTLLDSSGEIDGERFPSFASLAADSTFYRDATTVHAFTEHAVPSALTGKLPDQGDLPIYANHRQNLFTLLGNGYELKVRESLTHLCPVSLCRPTALEPVGQRLSSLASDSALVYLHVLLPDPMARGLPPVDQTWRDFRGMNVVADTGKSAVAEACAPVCNFVRGMTRKEPATLHYLHMQLPHIPWRYLPSGQHYAGDTRVVAGLDDRVWGNDEFLVEQGYQRYLLQAGYADRALGLILARLHKTKLYDRALVVVMADHGVSFQAGQPRRDPDADTLHDLAFMPLFVKLPGQTEGEVTDGFVRTIDVLPTIADVLGVDLPKPVDGRSLLSGAPKSDGTVRLLGKSGDEHEAPLSELLAARDLEVQRWTTIFGDGWDDVYRAVPWGAALTGREVELNDLPDAEGMSVELDSQGLLDDYDPDGAISPAWVTGRINGGTADLVLGVAVNGEIVTSTRSYKADKETRFAAFVPDSSLQAGKNDVEIVYLAEGGQIRRIPPSGPAFVLDGDALRLADGTALQMDSDRIRGAVETTRRTDRIIFSGWAVDADRHKPVGALAVFVDGRLVHTVHGLTFHTVEPEQHDGVDDSGFRFTLPANLVPPGSDVRVFAISTNDAAELG